MADRTTTMLEELLDIDKRLYAAVTDKDLEAAATCLEERSSLLDRLMQQTTRKELQNHPRWNTLSSQLSEQQQTIQKKLNAYQAELQDQLQEVSQFNEANRAYHRSDKSKSKILAHDVEG